MRSFDHIDDGITDLITHKSEFVFSGDQVILNKVFNSLGIDPKKVKQNKKQRCIHEDPNSDVSKAIAKLAKNIEH